MDEQGYHIADARLAAYLDGELPAAETQAVARHVAACGMCRSALDEMKVAQRAVQDLPHPEGREGLWQRVEAELDAVPQRRHAVVRGRPRIVVAAAAVLLVASVAFLAWGLRGGQEDASTLPVVSALAPLDLGVYLSTLDRAGRVPTLPAAYRQRPMSGEEALHTVARSVELDMNALPPTLTFEQAYLIEKEGGPDGFRFAQLIYRHEGRPVLVFCQPRDYAVSFSDFPAEPTTIRSRRCLKVRCGNYRAYSFSTKNATYTVVGQQQDASLQQIVQAMNGS